MKYVICVCIYTLSKILLMKHLHKRWCSHCHDHKDCYCNDPENALKTVVSDVVHGVNLQHAMTSYAEESGPCPVRHLHGHFTQKSYTEAHGMDATSITPTETLRYILLKSATSPGEVA